jgi:hypothetical protein
MFWNTKNPLRSYNYVLSLIIFTPLYYKDYTTVHTLAEFLIRQWTTQHNTVFANVRPKLALEADRPIQGPQTTLLLIWSTKYQSMISEIIQPPRGEADENCKMEILQLI